MVTEYVLGPDGNGRWVLFERLSGAPIRSFPTQQQGLGFSRVYVGRKVPARLVVQSQDGNEISALDYGD
jgi:hypothetical protein